MADKSSEKQSGEIAVSIDYLADEHSAPIVTSTGRGSLAKLIKSTALRYGVSVKHLPELAKRLVKEDVNNEIPEETYQQVADLLVAEENLKKK